MSSFYLCGDIQDEENKVEIFLISSFYRRKLLLAYAYAKTIMIPGFFDDPE
jgi:hypothetical protein